MEKQQKKRIEKQEEIKKQQNNIEREAQDQSACLSLIDRHHSTKRREPHTLKIKNIIRTGKYMKFPDF